MRNPLQEQLLKAGLVKKSKVDQVAREQTRQRHAKSSPPPAADKVDVQRLQAERAERDRALAAERNAQARIAELQAQIRQLVETSKVPHEGEIAYRFADGDLIKTMWVDEASRKQLIAGALVIVRHGDGYALLPRAAAAKVRERNAAMIVLDHGSAETSSESAPDDEYYARFQVPDDLVW